MLLLFSLKHNSTKTESDHHFKLSNFAVMYTIVWLTLVRIHSIPFNQPLIRFIATLDTTRVENSTKSNANQTRDSRSNNTHLITGYPCLGISSGQSGHGTYRILRPMHRVLIMFWLKAVELLPILRYTAYARVTWTRPLVDLQWSRHMFY